jgi:hypothetical protein
MRSLRRLHSACWLISQGCNTVVLIDMTYLYSEMLGALIVDNNQSGIPWYVASQKKKELVFFMLICLVLYNQFGSLIS